MNFNLPLPRILLRRTGLFRAPELPSSVPARRVPARPGDNPQLRKLARSCLKTAAAGHSIGR
jgi:hypothetical protein